MTDEKQVFSIDIAGQTLSVEIGEMAKQASGAAMIKYGDTSVLSTATGSKEPKDLPFFPLTINYEERLYAVGKIPGGFIKREGRPSDKAVLTARLIDRPIRPLFPDGFRNDIQVINTVMSVDQDCSSEIAAMIGSSIALSVSDLPFGGPIAGVVVGRVDGELVINPTIEQQKASDIDLTVAGTKDAVNMVEAGALEVLEEDMLEAIMFGHEEIKRLVEFQEEIVQAVGKEKREFELLSNDEQLQQKTEREATSSIVEAIQINNKKAREEAIDQAKKDYTEKLEEEGAEEEEITQVKSILDDIVKAEVRRLITKEKIRPDGRAPNEIRPLTSRVDVLPRTHGSGMFTRGQTQALSVCTLGALGEVQILDGLDLEESKRFMHHYNFPNFSVGETGPIRGPGRREIGHGALGERALEVVIPSEEEFPYTIRLVSEVLESNGSTSQASICASTMAMMDAGVPIKAPVAGIAMGLVKSGDDYTILTDIQGMEDFLGDMDFKVAGTEQGVTALQMDIKIEGLSREILKEALEQAKSGRMDILSHMQEVIPESRKELASHAPKIMKMSINPNKIRDVIGPSGKQINQIIEDTGVKIDIEQDGTVFISSQDNEMNKNAKKVIEDIVREVEAGEIYEGTVKRVEKFGAFVELFKGKEGLVHISELAEEHVKNTEDIAKVGDTLTVKVKEIDKQGRINLSRKAILLDEKEKEQNEAQSEK
ncbi:polyribonucleotide nucleotidyltransferase [Salimicrobium flavidum]|uniref:Polyribonucleotide nucleotidyltransferase n=1 Tax=Salimicrobium flavidum TaxID=570947 RepID=A0A1N7IK72_9BACI|nr:polyribonucleotide nucleotidyltransferase [Salimicrobium flavidum]SIS37489.1 polyribonucleotide nucleotidyltransferase [Salimicrobium flavidum]